jgi:hypothetical protein
MLHMNNMYRDACLVSTLNHSTIRPDMSPTDVRMREGNLAALSAFGRILGCRLAK